MKKVLLFILVIGGGWWYFHGGRVLSEESIENFYRQQTVAILSRNPEALCNQLANDYQSSEVAIASSGRSKQELNKQQSCEATQALYTSFEKIGNTMGGILQLDYDHKIQSITISSDKKTATIETTFKLDVAGSIMNFSGSSTDTLIRRNGKVLLQRTESKVVSSSG